MTSDTLTRDTPSTFRDHRDEYADWQDVDRWVVDICLSVIDSALDEREMTAAEADAYRKAMKLPVYSRPVRPLPFRE